jgi:hypothetical protein
VPYLGEEIFFLLPKSIPSNNANLKLLYRENLDHKNKTWGNFTIDEVKTVEQHERLNCIMLLSIPTMYSGTHHCHRHNICSITHGNSETGAKGNLEQSICMGSPLEKANLLTRIH